MDDRIQGKGSRNRSLTKAYRKGYDRIFRRGKMAQSTKVLDKEIFCSIDGDGFSEALERTKVENAKSLRTPS